MVTARLAKRLVVAAAIGVAAAACASKPGPSGLELTLDTTGLLPGVDYDTLGLTVSQQAPDGTWLSPIFTYTAPVKQVHLPATFSIDTGASADQLARIRFSAFVGTKPVVLREVIVQLPRGSVDMLELTLARDCLGQVNSDDTPTCVAVESAPYSCQPSTGTCGPDLTVLGGVVAASDAGEDATLRRRSPDAGRDGPSRARDSGHDATGHDATEHDSGHDAGKDAMKEAASPEASPLSDASCGDAACTVVAVTAGVPAGLVVDQHNVYWSVTGSQVIYSCPYDSDDCHGGSPYITAPLGGGVSTLSLQGVDGGALLFIQATAGGAVIGSCAQGCEGDASALTSGGTPTSMANDGTSLYWTSADDDVVRGCPLTACPGSEQDYRGATRDGGRPPLGIVSDGTYLYWLDPGLALEERSGLFVPDAGEPSAGGVASDAYMLTYGPECEYWTEPSEGMVVHGEPFVDASAPFARGQGTPRGIAAWTRPDDKEYLAWANSSAGTIALAYVDSPCATSEVQVIASGLDHPDLVAVDLGGKYLYWTEQGSGAQGTVRRLTIPYR